MSEHSAPRPSWTRVRAVLEGASSLVGAARDDYLARACGADSELRHEIDALLAADSDERLLQPPRAQAVARALGGEAESVQRVGPWRLERELGNGGMGVVWLAHRVEGGFEQRAAVKLIKRGMDSDAILRRFERERALLASLEHPGIARLYDGGAADDGRPYLAMEFVDGAQLDAHCARADLPKAEKLELFARVCDAVQHAHEHLVVHRDLKPANILVAAGGQPKLLDFGIAKVLATDGEDGATRTNPEQRVLTPLYASPEQLRGEPVTTKSDVYALGLILHEVLTGRRVFDTARRPDSAVAPPSRTTRRLAGDLDTIVAKATRAEPQRRYASAAALAEDVRRHLANEPVLARPDTWRYRATKFARRNVVLVASTLLVIAALSIGLALAWTQYRDAESARQVAETRLASVARIAASLTGKLSTRLEQIEGILPQREALLRDMTFELETLAREAPLNDALAVQLARARTSLAAVLGRPRSPNAGRYDEARALLEQTLAELEPRLGTPGVDFAVIDVATEVLSFHALLEQNSRRFDEARSDLARALDHLRTAGGDLSEPQAIQRISRECDVINNLLALVRDLQLRDEEARLSEEYVALVERAADRFPDHHDFRYWLAAAWANRGITASDQGDVVASRADLRRAIERLETLHAEDPASAIYRRALCVACYQLSGTEAQAGDALAAWPLARRAWELHQETLQREPDDLVARDEIVAYAYNAGWAARQVGDLDGSRAAFERTLEALDERMRRHPEHRVLRMTRAAAGTQLAAVLAASGEWRQALELAAEVIDGGLELEHDPGRGKEWSKGMAVAFSNSAECRLAAGRDSGLAPGERRAHLESARRDLLRAHELLQAAEAGAELGADDRAEFDRLAEIGGHVDRELAAIPAE